MHRHVSSPNRACALIFHSPILDSGLEELEDDLDVIEKELEDLKRELGKILTLK